MHVASVTLDEVLRAAARRAAALVPETAAYLALAIGDASARLPYRLDDELVTLTTEGTVRVARGRTAVRPEEGARGLRDLLRRLLSVSAGSMPGLAQAATPRREQTGPDAVVAEIESALIPVNRAAARRSLARLARDTARARDAGRLAAAAPPPAPPPAASAPLEAPPAAPSAELASRAAVAAPTEVAMAAVVEDVIVKMTPSAPIVAVTATDAPAPREDEEVATPFEPSVARPRALLEPAVEEATHRLVLPSAAPEEPSTGCHLDGEVTDASETGDATTIDPEVVMVAATDDAEPAPAGGVEQAARSLEEALRRGALAVPAAPAIVARPASTPRRPWQADLAPAALSDVDALLARFRSSEAAAETTTMRRDLKQLVGIDATQLPPRVASRAR